MRNLDITPYDVVPVPIRLQIYQEAIDFLKTKRSKRKPYGTGLCLLLPCLLWDLDDYLEDIPIYSWTHHDTPTMFPEVTDKVINIINMTPHTGKKKPQDCKDIVRIELLNQFINSLK